MRFLFLVMAAVAIAVAPATSTTPPGSSSFSNSSTYPQAPESGLSPNDAARLAKQASFGPTPKLIEEITKSGSAAAWLDEQFSRNSSSYADFGAKAVPGNYCASLAGENLSHCNWENFSATPVQMRFYANAIGKDDQLRQRVSFALSQIVVTSEQDVRNTAGLANFEQILLSNSFGNYRDILRSVTLDPFMGDYLDMADSDRLSPNENYARELMQLFSLGTALLNLDGTQQLDNLGSSIPAYSATDIREISRSLTGWTFFRFEDPKLNAYYNRNFSKPLVKNPAHFDPGQKSFLGKVVPAGATQEYNVDAVVDAVFNHPNTAPFISKRLIQQLTIANPTPAYVGRVASVFVNNGSGVRGDMKAVIRAIYLDAEARGSSQLPGKVKEPVLLATSLARAIGVDSDGYVFTQRDAAMGQAPYRATSVFNFYPYDFPLPQGAGLISPVSKLINFPTIMARHNFIYDWTFSGDATRNEFQRQVTISYATGTSPNWASWEAYGADDGRILDRINLVMLNGTMTSAQRQSLLTAMAAIKNSDPKAQTRKRAQMALYVVASSPLFQVDR